MAALRSQDSHFVFGFPSKLNSNQLPTKLSLYCHSQFLRREKIASGGWFKNVSTHEVAMAVANDCAQVWNLTGIPHQHGTDMERYIVQKIKVIIEEGNKLKKIPKKRRSDSSTNSFEVLFDIAVCQHTGSSVCDCPKNKKVPDGWKEFLMDQRNSRGMFVGQVDRAATRDVKIELEKTHVKEEKKKREDNRRDKWKEEGAVQFQTVSGEEFESSCSDSDTDGEWEDIEQPKIKRKKLSLPRFAKECDRYKVSNRAGAALANALLKDHGILTKDDTSMMIDHSKLRRERIKAGQLSEKRRSEQHLGNALYFDGKKCPTLVREVTSVKVQKRGMRGRGSSATVQTKRVKLQSEEHYTVVEQPDAKYLTHFTPDSGSGRDIAREIVDIVCEKDMRLEVLGCDGTAVNTGENNGAMRIVELDIGKPLHHFVCLLHTNELSFRHLFAAVDGGTTGPNSFDGPIGQAATEDVWKLPITSFETMRGKTPTIPDTVVDSLSRDQKILYLLARAVETGFVPEKVIGATIGPANHSRWLTLVCRVLRLYLSRKRPTLVLKRLVNFIINHYVPCWFKIKCHPHCQDGAQNFYYMVELLRDLPEPDQVISQEVLQRNGFWSHQENLIIGFLADKRAPIRTKAVNYIIRARRDFDQTNHPRKFSVPKINFDAKIYVDLIDWDSVDCTEPPMTVELNIAAVKSALDTPLILPAYPNHTQSVEHMIPLVTESCKQRVGSVNRHRWILNTIDSREKRAKFESKQDDMCFD